MSVRRKGRPPKDAVNVERWTGFQWIPDDGKTGQAFVGQVNGCPFAWAVDIDDERVRESPLIDRAMKRCAEKWRCANGREL